MSDLGKTNIVVFWTVGPDAVAEGDRIFESHARWMQGHPREGDEALLKYTISKGPQLADPTDPNSAPTGNTIARDHRVVAADTRGHAGTSGNDPMITVG